MKRFILPLQSILLMLLLIGCADINTSKTTNNYIHPIEQNKMPTETTEQMFYDFVRYDLLKGLELTSDTILYFDGFPNANLAYATIISFIVPVSERSAFDKSQRYESDILTIQYTEKQDVIFAELLLNFKNRNASPEITVLFTTSK